MTGEGLRRELGLLEVTVSGVGIILGAGIYALLGEAAALAGNAVWLAFGISAVMAACTGLSYAELSSMFPRAGAEYDYVRCGFGRRWAFVIGWLILATGVLSTATVSLGFGGYLFGATGIPVIAGGVILVAGITVLAIRGIRETALFAIAMTLIEAAGIVFVIIIGLPHIGSVDYLVMPNGFSGVFRAAALVFFAYMGFEEMVKLAEETRDPERTVPKAVILALAVAVALYMLVTVSAVSVLGWEALAASPAPFAEIAGAVLGEGAFTIIILVALVATANTALLLIVAASRLAYGMAEGGSLPAPLARVHPRFGTPWIAVLTAATLSAVFLFAGGIAYVANATNFALFLTFMVINATVIVLRRRMPETVRPFRVPGTVAGVPFVPVLGILFSFSLLAQLDLPVIGLGLLILAAGVVGAYIWERKG
ncbi:APC family permease [Methanofollis fontis]|uniref:Amino acid transporter n=1 Tax=Methanofollis fontis TaxID=2052832 RepID=A0A483CZE1_9EURY|nr:APC family permease [Methanofollis fontis]TAJ45449.1 amino acid transporter [Methanofollis fontis]